MRIKNHKWWIYVFNLRLFDYFMEFHEIIDFIARKLESFEKGLPLAEDSTEAKPVFSRSPPGKHVLQKRPKSHDFCPK